MNSGRFSNEPGRLDGSAVNSSAFPRAARTSSPGSTRRCSCRRRASPRSRAATVWLLGGFAFEDLHGRLFRLGLSGEIAEVR